MPENTPITPQTPVAPEEHKVRNINPEYKDRIAPAQPAFQLPEKFKSNEDLLNAYTEAEKKITEYGTKYKDYDDYSAIGKPSAIKEALEWARNVKTAMEQGLLKPAAEAQATQQQQQQPSKHPWEDEAWAYKQPGEQAQAIADYTQSQIKTYVDQLASQYGQQIQSLRQTDGREKAIMLKTLQAVAKNPNLDANDLLAKAAQYAGKSPEDLLDMVMEMELNTPEARDKALEAKVAARVAEEQQKWEKSKFTDILQTQRPKFGRTPQNREAENRSILEALSKQGIRF
jgi:hypothetical protein